MNPKKSKQKKEPNRKEMPFLDHLEELRWRILKSLGSVILFTCIAFPFTGFLLNFLTLPNSRLPDPAPLIFLKPVGMLMVRMEIAIAAGVVVSLPIIFYQFWQFVAPGLLAKEKKYFLPALFFTTSCFLIGATFAYTILIPTILPFLFSMGTESINPNIEVNDYMSFVLRLILVAGLIFELPVLSFFLSRIGFITPNLLKKYRRYGIVLVFIFSAFVTPPDPMSQLMMAFPLLFLYEISIWVSMLGFRRKKASDKAWEEESTSSEREKNNKDKTENKSK
ncbi:twin-arginine translocase subunit TatC [bacterium]|nr:twin-arginine translocase subunit TatC [bacterium]RQV95994.1 MAG: twin-arginine translocase subunit TatC [bacterium]